MRSAKSLCVVGVAFGLVLAATAVGCGSGKSRDGYVASDKPGTDPSLGFGSGDASSSTLALEPESATVIIDTAANPVVAGSLVYKVLKLGEDVTGGATFALQDPSLGSFRGATFTSVASLPNGILGKSTSVHATTPDGTALGSLTVVALRKTGPQRDFFFVVPYGLDPSPKDDTLKFSTNIKQADVAFSMDTTYSMDSAIDNLKSALQTTLMTQLQAAIPNVGLAVVDFRDFGDDWVVLVRQPITNNLTLAQAAVGAMFAGGGGNIPEASIASMQYILTGAANRPIVAHTNTVPGTWGAVDFRTGAVPVVVNITDASWHDPSGNATMASLQTAFAATKAKFVGVTEGKDESDPNTLSDATNSNVPPSAFGPSCPAGQCCTGVNGAARPPTGPGGTCRLNFLSSGGGGVGSSIVTAISAIAVGTSFDVKATPRNDPKNAGGVDATKFIQALRAMDEGNPAEGCPAAAAKDSDGDGIKDTFVSVNAGTPVCFEVVAAINRTVPAAIEPQFFTAFVDVTGVPGNLLLDTRSVLFLVPPKVSGVN